MKPPTILASGSEAKPAIGHNSSKSLALSIKVAVVYIATGLLKASPRQLRIHSKKDIGRIARNIEAVGFLFPILVDADFNVICGQARLAAALLRGLTEIPVVQVEHLTAEQIYAVQIADNKLVENATWDRRLLGETLLELSAQHLDIDLDMIGFEVAETDLLIEEVQGAADDADEGPIDGPLVTRPGDVWEVLDHRIYCGDSRSEASYTALMAGELAAATIADPPYNCPIQDYAAGFGKTKYAEFACGVGEMSEAEYTDFLIVVFTLIATFSAEGALAYTFADWRHVFENLVAGRRAFAGLRNFCTWIKPSGGQGGFYRSRHELIPVWIAKPGKLRNNIQMGRFGLYRTNVWEYDRPSRPDGEDYSPMLDHATPKPAKMIADAILDCTARGDIVLDPFLGGGGSLIGAERTGRRCRAIEIEPRFVDSSIRRLRRLSGEDARRLSDGRLFSELEKEAPDGEV